MLQAICKCDKCGKRFSVGDIKVKSRVLDHAAQGVHKYFICPKCGAEYTVIVSDPELNSLIKAGKTEEARRYAQELREKYFPEGDK